MGDLDLQRVCAMAGRAAPALTRRDVAQALLRVPAAQALTSLPALRRELLAAGRPLSALFWERAEELLTAISHGEATVGDVRRWLEATGSEPTMLVAGGFLWPEEDERGPATSEMHARLVAHLDELIAAGRIDPDALLAGDEAALAAYEQLQVDWLRTPLEDGREPMWVVSEEEDEELLAAWDEAEADARQILNELLEEVGPRPCPETRLSRVCARLRQDLRDAAWPYDLLRDAGGMDPEALPADDRELWLRLAAGIVTGGNVPLSGSGIDDETHAAWMALQHPDWIGAVVTLARSGPSAPADPDALATYAAAFDFEEDAFEPDAFEDDAFLHDAMAELDDVFDLDLDLDLDLRDVELSLSIGFHTVTLLWRLLGAIDEDERLTELGWWGLPEALDRAWRPPEERA